MLGVLGVVGDLPMISVRAISYSASGAGTGLRRVLILADDFRREELGRYALGAGEGVGGVVGMKLSDIGV